MYIPCACVCVRVCACVCVCVMYWLYVNQLQFILELSYEFILYYSYETTVYNPTCVTTQNECYMWRMPRIISFFWLVKGKMLKVLSCNLVGVTVSGCVFIVIVSSVPVVFGYQPIYYVCFVS